MAITVYHGSTVEIRKPDITFSKKYVDFGKGFYVTTFQKQAERWALRRSLRTNSEAIVNVYELSEDYTSQNVLTFEDDSAWLDFVCACRRGENIYQQYDVIIGNVANDDIFKSVDMYFRGVWDKQKTIEELRYYKKNDQFAFVKQFMLDKYLKFVNAYKVVKNG